MRHRVTGWLLLAALGAGYASAAPEPEAEVILLDSEPAPQAAAPEPATPQPSLAQPPALEPRPAASRSLESSELKVQALWFSRKAYLERNELERAAEQLRAMQEYRQQEGFSSLEAIAGAFSYEGFRQLEAGQYGPAHASFRLAKEFDPELPHAYYGQARSLRALRMGWMPALREAWEGLRVALRNFWSAYLLLGNLSLISFVALSAAGAAFLLALVFKYQPLLRHDLVEWLGRRRVPERLTPACAWALFLLPLLAGLGWMWVLLAWSAAVFPYTRRTERALATLVLLWGVASLPAARLIGGMFQTSVNPEVRNLVAVLRGGYDPARVRFLQDSVARDPDNSVTHFLLGALHKAGGYLNESLVHYKRAVDLDPRLHQAVNNLGNLYYLTQNYAIAQQQYQQAVELRPDFAVGFFNLHLAQYQQFNIEEAERSLETARRLDPDGLGAARKSDLPRSVLDARLDLEELWPSVAARARAGGASEDLSGGWTHPYALAATGATAIAWATAVRRRRRRARRCFKCGKPFCYACRSGTQFPDFCTQCVHLFAKRDGLAPATKKAKIAEVQRYAAARRRVSRLLSALVPGLGHVWADRALVGFLGMAAWALSLLALVGHDRLLRFYEVAYADARSLAPLLAMTGASLTWAVVNLVPPVRED